LSFCIYILLLGTLFVFTDFLIAFIFFLITLFFIQHYIFRKSFKVFIVFLPQFFLLTGYFSVFFIDAFTLSLSSSWSLQLYIIWSTVWSSLLQMHVGFYIILNLWNYVFILPCAFTMAVNLLLR